MAPAKFRRTQYITDLSLQLKYIGAVLGIVVVFFGMSIWVVYVTGWSHLVERLSAVYPQGRLVEILRVIYARLALGFVLLLPLAVFAAVFISHTIAGPLVRIKRYLRLMARGEFDLTPLSLRRFDELKEVAQLINEITAGLGPRMKERKGLVKSMQETLQALRGDLTRLPSVGQEVHRKVNFLSDTLRVLE